MFDNFASPKLLPDHNYKNAITRIKFCMFLEHYAHHRYLVIICVTLAFAKCTKLASFDHCITHFKYTKHSIKAFFVFFFFPHTTNVRRFNFRIDTCFLKHNETRISIKHKLKFFFLLNSPQNRPYFILLYFTLSPLQHDQKFQFCHFGISFFLKNR